MNNYDHIRLSLDAKAEVLAVGLAAIIGILIFVDTGGLVALLWWACHHTAVKGL